eukprot:TRINITY_DN13549_c0_g1_i2.p2 TRINITY_DN13549_c0_g1~~TRINITY_DN13549_c0_g1_i2.p2  ORF type:complete len:266 (+),score=35.51 TRINITY_DN13549_c0_g1_i2:685-1482(+)
MVVIEHSCNYTCSTGKKYTSFRGVARLGQLDQIQRLRQTESFIIFFEDLMTPWYVAFILGIVEGLTEFLPISSTGHLIIIGHLLNFTGPKAETFEIVIQLGAILAVVVLYWDRFTGLIIPDSQRKFSGIYGLWLLFLTSLPASILGLLTHSYIKQYLFSPTTVAVALAVGAVFIFVVEGINKKKTARSLDELTPKLALGIGLFQCLALWPGFSRSASTIMGGMLLGTERKVAAEQVNEAFDCQPCRDEGNNEADQQKDQVISLKE